jgi:hypothetical protein
MRTSISHPLQIAGVQPFEGSGRIGITRSGRDRDRTFSSPPKHPRNPALFCFERRSVNGKLLWEEGDDTSKFGAPEWKI